jgi:hypothetical protein
MVQELCAGGDIASLQTATGGRLEEAEAAAIMHAVLRFLAAAHRAGICYGDGAAPHAPRGVLGPCSLAAHICCSACCGCCPAAPPPPPTPP